MSDANGPILMLLAAVGGYVVFKNVVLEAVSAFLAMAKGPTSPRKYGKWVVITGATDGIGRAMAFEFASKGMNVFLLSRTESKLKATAEEIVSKTGGNVEAQYLAVDFSKFDEAQQTRVSEALQKLDQVGILVNNVGMSYPFPMYFDELTDNDVQGLIELNVNATTWMTRVCLPLMIHNKKGCILNVGSAAGSHPSPLLAVYSATKAYVEAFSHSLNSEYSGKGIDVQVHVPFFIVSKLSKFKRPSAFVPTAEAYAKMVLANLGLGAVVNPHTPHRVAAWILDCFPESILQTGFLKYHLGIRKLGFKKRAREEAAKK